MRSTRYGFALILVMLSCSLVLASCETITAQAITQSDTGSRGNGGAGMNVRPDTNGMPGIDGGSMGRNGGQGRGGGRP
ncbi:hypothetical protein BBD42_03355 [Paenibacillus sp. BIHB 4019]|uniref:Uncharacterized protein n=1 Tax=Paenibacillus sp. BIHB 4019 TaxID=1870819 RepID=A0A1B2DD07_9BACL|nr:hypothetical protein [Paenibacillus sp. BIHB 4019]ANY65601.1 hypothetical protein BBD42_03355 [Paenibacillus sp. BIHB 4019]